MTDVSKTKVNDVSLYVTFATQSHERIRYMLDQNFYKHSQQIN